LRRLLNAGANRDLFTACASGDLRQTRIELQTCRDEPLGIHLLPLLHFAVVNDDLPMLEALIRDGVAVNPAGAALSPLHSAVAQDDRVMLEVLLAAGGDPNAQDAFGSSVLDWAADLHGIDSAQFAVLGQSR